MARDKSLRHRISGPTVAKLEDRQWNDDARCRGKEGSEVPSIDAVLLGPGSGRWRFARVSSMPMVPKVPPGCSRATNACLSCSEMGHHFVECRK